MWDGFVDGPGRTTALRAVMACLGETESCERLIARLASAAIGASLSDDRLSIRYPDDWTLTLAAPFVGRVAETVPASLAELARQINGIKLDTDDLPWIWPGLTEDGELAQPAGFDPRAIDDPELLEALAAEGLEVEAIAAPIRDRDDWVVYHPFARTAGGEPVLCMVRHGVMGDPLSYRLGFPATALRLLTREVLHDDRVPWDE